MQANRPAPLLHCNYVGLGLGPVASSVVLRRCVRLLRDRIEGLEGEVAAHGPVVVAPHAVLIDDLGGIGTGQRAHQEEDVVDRRIGHRLAHAHGGARILGSGEEEDEEEDDEAESEGGRDPFADRYVDGEDEEDGD